MNYFTRLFLLIILSLPSSALAAVIPEPGNAEQNPVKQVGFMKGNAFIPDSLESILNRGLGGIVNTFMIILSALAVLFLIYAGIQYVTAGGSAEKTKKARQSIINIVLGIVLIIATYAILAVIIGILNSVAGRV